MYSYICALLHVNVLWKVTSSYFERLVALKQPQNVQRKRQKHQLEVQKLWNNAHVVMWIRCKGWQSKNRLRLYMQIFKSFKSVLILVTCSLQLSYRTRRRSPSYCTGCGGRMWKTDFLCSLVCRPCFLPTGYCWVSECVRLCLRWKKVEQKQHSMRANLPAGWGSKDEVSSEPLQQKDLRMSFIFPKAGRKTPLRFWRLQN